MDIGRRQATAVVVTPPGHSLLEKVTILEALGEAVRAGVELNVQCLDMGDSVMAGLAPTHRTQGLPAALFVCAGELWSLDGCDALPGRTVRLLVHPAPSVGLAQALRRERFSVQGTRTSRGFPSTRVE